MNAEIEDQTPDDEAAIEALLDRAFGPDRHGKTAYRFRDGVSPVEGLSLVARDKDRLVGTIRFWPAVIEATGGARHDALLLGPIAVEEALKGKGVGRALMKAGLDRARAAGHRIVLLVGDLDYYGRMGFARVPAGTLGFPGPVDAKRLLYLELVPGAFEGLHGSFTPVRTGAA